MGQPDLLNIVPKCLHDKTICCTRDTILTIDASIVRLNERALDLAVLHHQGVTLAPLISKNGSRVEKQVKLL
jgi:hypothetical protein